MRSNTGSPKVYVQISACHFMGWSWPCNVQTKKAEIWAALFFFFLFFPHCFLITTEKQCHYCAFSTSHMPFICSFLPLRTNSCRIPQSLLFSQVEISIIFPHSNYWKWGREKNISNWRQKHFILKFKGFGMDDYSLLTPLVFGICCFGRYCSAMRRF